MLVVEITLLPKNLSQEVLLSELGVFVSGHNQVYPLDVFGVDHLSKFIVPFKALKWLLLAYELDE